MIDLTDEEFARELEIARQDGVVTGWNASVASIMGPRQKRPAGITDDQWVNWYGAKRNDDGTITPPMSVAHLFPSGKRRPASHWPKPLEPKGAASV